MKQKTPEPTKHKYLTMNDFQKPIQRIEKSPIEQPHEISPIEKDKKREDDEGGYPSGDDDKEKTRLYLIATLFSTIKKMIGKIEISNISDIIPDPAKLKKDLKALREMFLTLCHNDQSHDSEYLYNLSELWHGLLSDFSNIDIADRDHIPIAGKINDFTSEVLHYPPDEAYSLGYYLTEHAGREWIPFPLMDLLQDLYKQHQKMPASSKLVYWTTKLSDIIEDLETLPEFS